VDVLFHGNASLELDDRLDDTVDVGFGVLTPASRQISPQIRVSL
jgi:hypothetical protein